MLYSAFGKPLSIDISYEFLGFHRRKSTCIQWRLLVVTTMNFRQGSSLLFSSVIIAIIVHALEVLKTNVLIIITYSCSFFCFNFSNMLLNNYQNAVKLTNEKMNALEAMTIAKASGSKWRKYCSSRRKHIKNGKYK